MQRFSRIGILITCAIIMCILSTGCINANEAKITQATKYIDKANDRLSSLSSINISTVSVGNIRANASEAALDLREAKKLLDQVNINELSPQEQADIKALNVMISVYIEMVEMVEGPLADMIENTQAFSNTKDTTIIVDKAMDIKANFKEMRSTSSHMVDQTDTIDINTLSAETKEQFIAFKTLTQSMESDFTKASEQLDTLCLKSCNGGEVLGSDCQCHDACGTSYCADPNAICRSGQCYLY
jgi:hypothetical protein